MSWGLPPGASTRLQSKLFKWLLITFCSFAFQLTARADLVQGIHFNIPGIDYHNDGSWSLGYEFYLVEDVSLHALGYYDAGADGFNEEHAVGLWTLDGELLASTTVTNASVLDGWFRWETITPINLYADTSYVIAGFSAVDDYMWNPDDFEPDPRLYFSCARYTFSTELAVPEDCYWEYLGFFGPNLQISDELVTEPPQPVPTPASAWLFAAGILAAAVLYRGDRTQIGQPEVLRLTAGVATPVMLTMLLSSPAQALSVEALPVQGPSSWDGLVALGSRYQRYSHENVGAILKYDNVYDAEGNYIVPVGETLRWVWLRDSIQLGAVELTYVGGPSHCWVTASGVQNCGTYNKFYSFQMFRCVPDDKPFTLLAFREGVEILRHEFDSERFKIKSEPSRWTIPEIFSPKTDSSQTALDTQSLSFIVEDDLSCGRRLKDIEIELQSTVLSGSNGHDHFGAGERGTGAFSAVSGFPVERSNEDTTVTGKTDVNGLFKVRYSAVDFALTEKVKLSFKRPAKDGHPESKLDASFVWDIKLPDNFLEPEITPHGWNNGVGCIHNPAPRYLTPSAAAMLPWAFDEYTATSGGATLSANDASLPWGGKIDIPGATRSGCHKGHRQGIAIDINGTDSQNRDIWTATQDGKRLFKILEDAMTKNGFKIFEENDSIHYDFDPEPILP